jgi:tetratricopeptide (TPR) repeat protein
MSRVGRIFLILAVLAPATAVAQRPSKNLWINTAELELGRAVKNARPEEQAKLFERAMENARMAVEKDADTSRSWFVLGRVQAAMGNLAAADSAFDKAEQMWPEYVKETDDERLRAYAEAFRTGSAALQANDLATAVTKLEGARAIYSKHPVALLNLAIAYSRQNEREKAIGAFQDALKILRDPAAKGAIKPEEAKQWAQWEEDVSRDLAQALAFANRNEEAVQAYEAYLATHPENVTMRSNLAVVYSRMGKTAEAAKVYNDLLNQDLSADEFLSVGMGLRRAQQLDQATKAFEKSIAKNPNQQEAYYNLAYSVWETIQPLEDALATAKPADKTAMTNQLRPMYEKMLQAAGKAREFDPANRNVFALLQNAYRGMAAITTPVAKANEVRMKIPPLMTDYEALPFQIAGITPDVQDKKVKLTGTMVNVKTPKGQPMKIRLSVLSPAGAELATKEVSVAAPEAEADAEFTAEFDITGEYGGWKYTLVK